MQSKKPLYGLILAVVVTGLVVFLFVRQDTEDVEVTKVEAKAPTDRHPESIATGTEDARREPRTKERKRRKPKLPKNAIDKRKRAEVLALILSALQEKERRKAEKHSRESPKLARLPAKYIREAVNEIIPLLKECYEMELVERGKVSGKVVLGFDLIADDEHGGLVEEVRIEETELSKDDSVSFTECLRESVYALRLNAPEWGGRTTVRYPLVFRALGHDD
jgi:hypothetical protein